MTDDQKQMIDDMYAVHLNDKFEERQFWIDKDGKDIPDDLREIYTRLAKEYMRLPYNVVTVKCEYGEGYVAYVQELSECITQADTWSELGEMIEDAMLGWIEVGISHDEEIPFPTIDFVSMSEYEEALLELHDLMQSDDRLDDIRLNWLARQIEFYEDIHYPIGVPSLWARIVFRIRQQFGI